MILNRTELRQYITDGKLAFTPALDSFQLQPNSIDLRVGWSFYVSKTTELTTGGRIGVAADYLEYAQPKEYYQLIKLSPGQCFEIQPKEFVIISTLEKVTFNDGTYAAMLSPRSSVIRRGLIIEGGVVDAFYNGHLIIPAFNSTNHAIKMYPGERVCQLVFHSLSSALSREDATKHGTADAKYQDATPYGLGAKTDSKEEVDFIRSGNIDGLKSQFQVK
ncbi:MAG: dCTP deaminase [Patescibacteria group bacterium]